MDGTTIDRVLAAAAAGAWRCVQTHLSCVVVRGDRVFKLKKPVSLGFVDFARAEARRDACVEEVRLNRRLAPEIYLGVAPLVESAGGVDFGPVRERAEAMAGERVIDWATAMRRLPEPGLLDGVLSRSAAEGLDVAGLGPALDRFAIRLARFHDACPTSPEIARWGHPVAVLRRLKNSLAGLHDHGIGVLAATVPPGEPTPWIALARLVGRRVQAAMPLLAERHARGLVREVHGDLHARNLCVVDGEIVAFDCIEFSFELRCRDIAADATRVGFDLAARGFDGLGRRFLAAWSDAAGDPGARAVFPVFAARDGIVHAFVESVTVGEPEVSAADRGVAAAASRNYAIVAAGYALPPSLVVMAGLPGTGKSVAARAAGTPLRATLLASDAVRKQLAGIAPDERGGPELYTPEWNARTYAELERRAGLVLAEGGHVIVDANNGRRSDRDRFRELARRHGAIVLVVEATCPEAEVLRRLAARTGDAREVSDAGPATYLRLRESFEPIDPASEGEPLRLTPACDAAARIAWRLAAIANARPSAPG